MLHAELIAEDCEAELFFNGVAVARAGGGEPPIARAPVDALAVPGTNELELVVWPGSTPSRARSEVRELPCEGATATAAIVRYEPGDLPGEGLSLFSVRYPETIAGPRGFRRDEGGPLLDVFPQTLVARGDLGAAHGHWAWQSAPFLTLGPDLVAEACAVLDEIGAAIEAGDADKMWQLCAAQIDEVCRAFPAMTRDEVRAELEERLGPGRERPLPRVPERHDFRLAAGGRMLECIDDDWSTSLKLRGRRGRTVGYRILLASIDGKLRVTR